MKANVDYTQLVKWIEKNPRVQTLQEFSNGVQSKQALNYYLNTGAKMKPSIIASYVLKYDFNEKQIDKFFFKTKKGGKNG